MNAVNSYKNIIPDQAACNGFDVSSVVENPEKKFLAEYRYDMHLFADTRNPLAHTKDISEVKATGKKPFAQKGTGGARQGSKVSAQHVGGGIAHGPRAKRATSKLNSKATKKAKRMALGFHFQNNTLFICDSFELDNHKTKSCIEMLVKFGCSGKRCIFIDDLFGVNLLRSSANLRDVSVWRPAAVTVHALFKADCVLISRSALDALKVVLS